MSLYFMKKTFFIIFSLSLISGCTILQPKSLSHIIFKSLDQNKDGGLTYTEFKTATTKDAHDSAYMNHEAKKKGISLDQFITSEFNNADTNHDGKMSSEEFYQRSLRSYSSK